MISYEDLGHASAANDAMTEERDFDAAIESVGIATEDAMAFAQQRAIRVALIISGEKAKLDAMIAANKPTPIQLTEQQQQIMNIATAACLDGLIAGIRAQRLEQAIDE